MQLSTETINILINYSQINQNLMFSPGKVIRTIHPSKAVFSSADIKEDIEGEAAILDLPRFLRTLSLLNEPSIEFGKKQFTLTDSKQKTKINYTYADPTSMLKVPTGTKDFPKKCSINLSAETLKSIMVAGKSLKLPSLKLLGTKEGKCFAELYDPKAANKDTFNIDISGEIGEIIDDFSATMNTDYINFVNRDYVVEVSQYAVKFDGGDIRYMVAVDSAAK